MKSTRYITALFAFAGISAFAQDINKEITIEKEIVPEQRAATRLAVNHAVLSPETRRPVLNFNLTDRGVGIVPRFNPLAPASTLPAIDVSPYRGYASIGYFPLYNLGATAGYDIINNQSTILGASVQYIGYNYKSGKFDYQGHEEKIKRNDVTANVDFIHYFNQAQLLSMNVDFGWGNIKTPFNERENHTIRAGLDARWRSGSSTDFYTVGVRGGLFNFGGPFYDGGQVNYTKETTFGADFGLNYGPFSIDVDGSFKRDGKVDIMYRPENTNYYAYHYHSSKLISLVSAIPAFTFDNSDGVKVRIGAKVQYTAGSRGKFHVAPDVMVSIVPSSTFAFQADVRGGEVMNTVAEMYQLSPYMPSGHAYLTSNIPVVGDLKFVVGPFSGASVEIFGGYAITKNWLMPYAGYCFAPINLKGWHAGLKVAYSRGSWLDAWASAEIAPQKFDQGYYLWRDRAKAVVKANVAVRPIDKLRLAVGYELRTGRKQLWSNMLSSANPAGFFEFESLSSVNNLSFDASYQITRSITVFGRGENLLNHHYTMLMNVPAQGITGLVGVEVKF